MENKTEDKTEDKICPICIEKYTKTKNKIITCEFCQYGACKSCYKIYFNNIPEKAHCMNSSCLKYWNYESLINKFDRKFVDNDYKNLTENVLFNLEKSLLPTTQERLYKLKLKNNLEKELDKIRLEYREKINILRSELNIKENNIYEEIKNLDNKKKDRQQFVKKCPKENCRGFLSSGYICGMCDNKICSKCMFVLGNKEERKNNQTHICKEDDVASVELINKETKPCPKCGTNIFKISGCDQMFCNNKDCGTAFDWKTGNISTGVIHNPHFFEWQQKFKSNNNQIENNCNEYLFINIIRLINSYKISVFDSNIQLLSLFLQNIIHTKNFVLENLRFKLNENNEDLREIFLKNILSEDEFKRQIRIRDKRNEKNRNKFQIIELYTTISNDIISRLYNIIRLTYPNNETIDNIKKSVIEIKELEVYINELFLNFSKVYKSKIITVKNGLLSNDLSRK
jgi:hypothetical protein